MKFMQRAAASGSPAGSPSSDAPSSKKRKLNQSPAEARIDADISQAAVQAALDEREAKRLAALEQHATGDTHWVLKTNLDGSTSGQRTDAPLNVMYVGYGDIESSGESGDDENAAPKGRTSTKNYKPAKPPASQNPSDDEDGSSEASSSEDNEDSSKRKGKLAADKSHSKSPQNRSRSTSQSRHKAQDPKAKEFRDKRKKKEVPLNKLLSISSSGNQFGSQTSNKSVTCYNCNQAGHRASDCPRKGSRGSGRRS